MGRHAVSYRALEVMNRSGKLGEQVMGIRGAGWLLGVCHVNSGSDLCACLVGLVVQVYVRDFNILRREASLASTQKP